MHEMSILTAEDREIFRRLNLTRSAIHKMRTVDGQDYRGMQDRVDTLRYGIDRKGELAIWGQTFREARRVLVEPLTFGEKQLSPFTAEDAQDARTARMWAHLFESEEADQATRQEELRQEEADFLGQEEDADGYRERDIDPSEPVERPMRVLLTIEFNGAEIGYGEGYSYEQARTRALASVRLDSRGPSSEWREHVVYRPRPVQPVRRDGCRGYERGE